MEYIFEIENLEKSFGDNEVLKDINFKVKKGEVVSIIGSYYNREGDVGSICLCKGSWVAILLYNILMGNS